MNKNLGKRIFFGSMLTILPMSGKIYAGEQVNFSFVNININSCTSTMSGLLEEVSYTMTFPSAVTACAGLIDLSIFLTNLSVPMVANANAAFSVIATDTTYSAVNYLAPEAPCDNAGNACALVMGFSCYEPSTSTVFLGANGATCN